MALAVFVCFLCGKSFEPFHHHECQKECALESDPRMHRDFCDTCRTPILALVRTIQDGRDALHNDDDCWGDS